LQPTDVAAVPLAVDPKGHSAIMTGQCQADLHTAQMMDNAFDALLQQFALI
jgi:hypothetical protein